MAVYSATLAPDVTLWDAGEFNAAIGALGIPHPPGTPLYILLGYAWAKALGFLPQALAVNLLSAVATALACALLAGLMARWMQSRLVGIASGLTAGTMLAVWQNATETEVYAVAMLLGVLMVVTGEHAGRKDSFRLRLLLAYLIGLAIPVQISALVAAPAAILLASSSGARPSGRHLMALGGVLAVVAGISLGSATVTTVALVALLASGVGRHVGLRPGLEAMALLAVATVGMTATLFMLVRAGHDPFINQGNPSTFDAMMEVVWRRQYPLPGIWPRQAPVWVQLLAPVQYADWQVASGIDHSVQASWWRTPWTLVALALGVVGARWHLRRDVRGWRGTMLLLLGTSLGVVAVLNLRAGPSILDSVLPPGSFHEARERDYFFALAFATAGAWVGAGAVVAANRMLSGVSPRAAGAAGLVMAGLPLLLNWRAAERRTDAALAPTLGESLLASAPPNAVMLLAGDNDSYTTWFRQSVLNERRDVALVTVSLLPARWYREELARRHRLFDSTAVATWRGETGTLRALVDAARAAGRPVTAAVTVRSALRSELAPGWTLGGMAYVAGADSQQRGDRVDTAATRAVADLIATRRPRARPGRDPATAYVERILRCPSAALRLGAPSPEPAASLLDSRCNFK